jgi:DNA-binding transcriptional LysR family regulator
MELRHLRYFVALAEELHFARAAELLHMTQPALSHQIKALEDELGVRLFNRTKQEVKLTEPGAYFLAEAQLTLKQAERARAVAQRVARGQLGIVRIGYVPSLPFSGILSQIASEFRQNATEIQFVLEEMFAQEQLIKIAAGKLDVGIVGAGHNPYFGLNFNSSGTNFEGSGGGIGIFEDRSVEPLVFSFFRHYLLEGNKDLFTGEGVSNSTGRTTTSMHQ